jgi:hypothetical protein
MKRNMDLIREILLFAETNCDGQAFQRIDVCKLAEPYRMVEPHILEEHVRIAEQQGLIEISRNSSGTYIHRLTWNGHDFLADARQPEVWNAAKSKAGNASFAVFKAVLTQYAIKAVLG